MTHGTEAARPVGLGADGCPTGQPLRLATHSGTFHADDVLAHAILWYALRLDETPFQFVRSREPEVLAKADIVWDVGAVYRPEEGRYDHHMADRPLRSDGTPYSSAGLLWQDYGRAAIRSVLDEAGREEPTTAMSEEIWHAIDAELIRPVDEVDNGVGTRGSDTLSLAALVDAHNPPWDDLLAGDGAEAVGNFLSAARVVREFLSLRIDRLRAGCVAREAVLAAHAASNDPRILELDLPLPWQGAVHDAGLPVLYCVQPEHGGNWMVICTPKEPGSFEQKSPLPAEWRGLRGADLAAVSGVDDAVFAHAAGFIGGAGSRSGAIALARLALTANAGSTGG